MPHITGSFNQSGPLIEVLVGVNAALERAMRRAGREPPPRLRLNLLVDTGCDSTMLAEGHMRSLGIPARGERDILTATTDTAPTTCNTYGVSFTLHTFGDPPFELPALEVVTRPLNNLSIDGLIGWDVLQHWVVRLDGPQRRLRIDY